jgi:hypothetical protein
MTDTRALRDQLLGDLTARFGDEQEHGRVLARTQMIFDLFYDEAEDAPEQPFHDALLDLMHTADAAGVDFDAALAAARAHYPYEREEWGLDKPA